MSLFSSIVNAFSAQKAADAQKRAADAANNTIKQQYEQTRSDLAPYRDSGATANTQYSSLLGLNGEGARNNAFSMYQTDPGYQWQRQQAIDGVQGSAAARGSLFSGGAMKAISDRTQNVANQDYGNYLSRLSGQAAMGANAAAQTGQFGANAAAQRGGYFTDRGNANANSIMAPANGWRQFNQDVAQAAGAFAGGGYR